MLELLLSASANSQPLHGWYIGHRSAKKDLEDISNKLSVIMSRGQFCFPIKTDKAVDLFL